MKRKKLDIKTKKELLINFALKESYNGGIISGYIYNNYLNGYLKQINNIKQMKIFITNISNIIDYFDNNFIVANKSFLLTNIFTGETDNSLITKEFDKKEIQKIIIKNTYNNIKLIYNEHKKFFKKQKITPNLSLNNNYDINIIFKFTQKITLANYNNYLVFYIFENYQELIKEYNVSNSNITKTQQSVYNSFSINWKILIKNYKKLIRTI